MATKAKNKKNASEKKQRKPSFFTKEESEKVISEIDTLLKSMKKKHGKKFDDSFGASIVVLSGTKENGAPSDIRKYGNANAFTMREVAEAAVLSVAESTGESPMKVAAMVGVSTMLS